MKPLRVAFDVIGMHSWWGGDIRPVLEVAKLADRLGVDQVTSTDHVVMGENLAAYPYGPFPNPLDFPWFEPFVLLSAIAAVTERVRLSMGVLIAPLRPAVLLAKQVATLDVLSHGRVDLGVGTGWQKEEYEASGLPWEGRYTRLEEQLKVCQLLWREAPATFHGTTVTLDRIHAYPRPVQSGGVPLLLGVAPTERNCARMAELGAGWAPIVQSPEEVADGVKRIRAAYQARGRDPDSLEVRVLRKFVAGPDGPLDLEASLRVVPALRKAGATIIHMMPMAFCRGPEDVEPLLRRLVALKS